MRAFAAVASFGLGLGSLCAPRSAGADESGGQPELRRVTTAVPWPRGVVLHEGRLIVLARGVHRNAGGPNPAIQDMAGHLFEVDPTVFEPVVKGVPPGDAVRKNGKVFAAPTEPPFHLWNRETPSTNDTLTDRPYCTLAYDPESQNFFVCGYAGIDLADDRRFRKNATDSIHRYDLRTKKWYVVEAHRPESVPAEALGRTISAQYYPHHDVASNPPPHGLVNGPAGLGVAGRYLYAGAKDNTALAQYDLREIRRRPDAPPPPSRLIFHRKSPKDDVFLQLRGRGNTYVEGACSIASHGGHLYVAFRTTSQILRFPITSDGDVVRPLVGEQVAQFARYDPVQGGGSADVYDMTFDRHGRLYVAAAYTGRVFRFRPDPERLFDATDPSKVEAYVHLGELTDHPSARTGDIDVADDGTLYVCSGNKDVEEGEFQGTVYRYGAK
jgi:hypothetical protein